MEALNQRMANAEAQTRAMSDALSCITDLHEQLRHAKTRSRALKVEKEAVLSSLSWRVTAPLRWVGRAVTQSSCLARRLINRVLYTSINIFQRPLAAAMRFVLQHSALRESLNRHLMRYPALRGQLLGIAHRYDAISSMPVPVSSAAETSRIERFEGARLTPRARQIYHDLKTAIEIRQKENG